MFKQLRFSRSVERMKYFSLWSGWTLLSMKNVGFFPENFVGKDDKNVVFCLEGHFLGWIVLNLEWYVSKLMSTVQLVWQIESAQVDLHKKRANNPTFCRISKNEWKIALHNFEFPSSKLYVRQKIQYFSSRVHLGFLFSSYLVDHIWSTTTICLIWN